MEAAGHDVEPPYIRGDVALGREAAPRPALVGPPATKVVPTVGAVDAAHAAVYRVVAVPVGSPLAAGAAPALSPVGVAVAGHNVPSPVAADRPASSGVLARPVRLVRLTGPVARTGLLDVDTDARTPPVVVGVARDVVTQGGLGRQVDLRTAGEGRAGLGRLREPLHGVRPRRPDAVPRRVRVEDTPVVETDGRGRETVLVHDIPRPGHGDEVAGPAGLALAFTLPVRPPGRRRPLGGVLADGPGPTGIPGLLRRVDIRRDGEVLLPVVAVEGRRPAVTATVRLPLA